jgi:hypothetical protein
MRFFSGGPDVPIIWFFAADGAGTIEGPNSFCSRNWDDGKHDAYTIGEQDGPFPWRDGSGPADALGVRLCNDADLFQDGQSGPLDPPRQVTSNGLPGCCVLGPGGVYISGRRGPPNVFRINGRGGLFLSGRAIVT